MIGIDTNILLRVFVRDDPMQHAAALRLVESHGSDGIFVSALVLTELIRVLRRRLGRTLTETVEIVDRLIEAPEFVVETRSVIEDALGVYRGGKAEFSDCLIVATAKAAGIEAIYTFDQDAAKSIPGAILLSS